MASITAVMMGRGGGAERIERVAPDDARPALAMLLTGQAAAHDPAVDQFLVFAREQQLDLTELWAAFEGREPLAVALVVPSRGRTGMLFLSPTRGRGGMDRQRRLIQAVTAAQDPSRLRLLQALLDPFQRNERHALEAAGYQPLATLVYMQRATESFEPPPPRNLGDPTIRVMHYSEAARPLFEAAILASYEETQDCPGLLGVRPIEDILEGHRATGDFAPDLWFVFQRDDEPVGVMLLTGIPQRDAAELVYLGISKAHRGRGLGRRMLRIGLDTAARHGFKSLLLAVDEDNDPALALYRRFAFRPSARKNALICTLS